MGYREPTNGGARMNQTEIEKLQAELALLPKGYISNKTIQRQGAALSAMARKRQDQK